MDCLCSYLCGHTASFPNKSPLLWDRLVEEMEQGKDIVIQTPYIICSRMMYQDLAGIANEAAVERAARILLGVQTI